MTNKKDDDDDVVPSRVQIWKLASRPHTLTASIVPVLVGYALTIRLIHDNLDRNSSTIGPNSKSLPLLSIQYAIFASFIQLSTNLHNDYADYIKGADTSARVGQARATQRGWLTPHETCRGCVVCLGVALVVGLYCLIPIPHECSIYNNNGNVEVDSRGSTTGMDRNYYTYDPIMIFIVLSSMFNAVAYTGGPFPLGYVGLGHVSIGYSGLGDFFVFIYFGIVATIGVPYLYLTKISCLDIYSSSQRIILWQLLRPSFLHSIPVGLLATAIIVVNNLRDRYTDVHAGKRTLAVRYGERFARIEYLLLLLGSYTFCILSYCYFSRQRDDREGDMAWTALLPLASFPMAIPQLHAVAFGQKDGQALNDHVGGTAQLQLVYCILMATGLIISS